MACVHIPNVIPEYQLHLTDSGPSRSGLDSLSFVSGAAKMQLAPLVTLPSNPTVSNTVELLKPSTSSYQLLELTL